MKKIAIFSDIHGNLEALRSILLDTTLVGVDEIICLGDILGLGPSSSECLDLIIDNNVKLVLGNHDLYSLYGAAIDVNVSIGEIEHHEWVTSSLLEYHIEFLEKCQLSYSFYYKNKLFGFQHFLLNSVPKGRYPFKSRTNVSENLNSTFANTNYDYLFIGHDHMPFHYTVSKKHLIGVGSSGCTSGSETYYLILELGEKGVSVTRRNVIYDKDSFNNRINEVNYPEKEKFAQIFFGVNL